MSPGCMSHGAAWHVAACHWNTALLQDVVTTQPPFGGQASCRAAKGGARAESASGWRFTRDGGTTTAVTLPPNLRSTHPKDGYDREGGAATQTLLMTVTVMTTTTPVRHHTGSCDWCTGIFRLPGACSDDKNYKVRPCAPQRREITQIGGRIV